MSEDEPESPTFEEESSTSEEEDEDGKEWTEEIEKTFLKTLSSLKQKDPKIYDANVKFFTDEISKQNDEEQSSSSKKKLSKEECMYLRDYERRIILEKNGILTDEDSDEADFKSKHRRAASPTYVEEQKELKNSFKKFLTDDNETDAQDSDIAGFLKVKVKNAEEKAQEEEEYVKWLKGQKSELSDKEAEGELKYLRDYWTDPNLNEGEQFLRDYVLNKKYLETNEEDRFDSELPFSEEEEILKECDEYEQKYNFRFEEPDQNFIKTFPRVIEDSLRRKDEKRKRKREERKKKKEEQLAQKHLEVKRLKKQKKEEFMEKIQKLKELTGNKTLGFDDEELERDFDPEEFDRKMNQIYDDDFYNEEDADPDMGNDVNEDYDDKDFIMDCDYDPEAASESKFKKQTRASRRKGHKKTTFAEAVEKDKPVFDPANKTYQEYLDEYYGLDFEDMIDDLPCRYKYREVMPNDFGLTIEEILAADDKELNNWCSMKKIDTIRPEHNEKFDRKIYQKRAQNLELKKKYLPSLFKNENNVEAEGESTGQETRAKKKRKKRKKKSVSESNSSGQKTNVNEERNAQKRKADSHSQLPRNKKMKHSFSSGSSENFKSKKHVVSNDYEISDERLKAYGFNPKKYKNKMKYGGSDR